MNQEERWMARALALAVKGTGAVNPNPLVGAVIVKHGKVIGEGYHQQYGGPHAEPNAINSCSESPAGGEIYVTLEPCNHYGKTPPCTEAILQSGIRRVVIGALDPNPKMQGKSAALLREKGLDVQHGVLEAQCRELNRVFFHYITTGRPYLQMKYAMTLDGKIAAHTGESKWISGEISRQRVQEMRHSLKGILVGIGTVLQDDPLLTCRIPEGRNPVRIICDSRLRMPMDAQIVKTAGQVETIVGTLEEDSDRKKQLEDAGVTVITTTADAVQPDRICLRDFMRRLGDKKIDGILLEGGSTLNAAALQAGIVSRIQVFLAPLILGGADAPGPIGGIGAVSPAEGIHLLYKETERMGEDWLLTYDVKQ